MRILIPFSGEGKFDTVNCIDHAVARAERNSCIAVYQGAGADELPEERKRISCLLPGKQR